MFIRSSELAGLGISIALVAIIKAYRKILKISSISESPLNNGFRVHISAKMQPTDHISTPVEY